jgi:hypothetical protein
MNTAVPDGAVVTFLAERACRTAAEFGKQRGSAALPVLEWGEQPEYRAGSGERPPTIFLSRHGHDWWQVRYQIAHEVFHWLCTPPRTFHWSHELFAVETAVRAMGELGEHAYVEILERSLAVEAERFTLTDMLTMAFRPVYPDGLYGRAWATGRELIAAIGWERLKLLAGSFDDQGRPDVGGWILLLAPREQAAVQDVLGIPSSAWA